MKWIREIWYWIVTGKIFIMGILVFIATFILGFVTWRSEISIRSAGYGLQLLGMIFAIRGLLNIRLHFGQIPLNKLFIAWFKSFPKWKNNKVNNLYGTVHESSGLKGEVKVWTPDNPNQPVEKRIEAIIKNLERIKSENYENSKCIKKLIGSHEEHKKMVTEQSKIFEEKIRSDLKSLHTSDLITSLVGLIWLIVGITMSTMAQELYQWVK